MNIGKNFGKNVPELLLIFRENRPHRREPLLREDCMIRKCRGR
jgi:hypothetical protein